MEKAVSRLLRPLLRCGYHSSRISQNEQTILQKTPPIESIKLSGTGRKFKDLVQDLHQRSISLVEKESIQLPSSYDTEKEQSKKTTSSSSSSSSPSDHTQEQNQIELKSRRRRRTDFSEDPLFKFDRKRGKRHVMIKLKQLKSNGGLPSQSTKIQLNDHLDLNIRWNNKLVKVLFSLPSADQPIENQKQSGLNEFVKGCLGPLVWSNPKIDISLVYSNQLSKPTVTFWTVPSDDESSNDQLGMSLSSTSTFFFFFFFQCTYICVPMFF
ncbi:hypothetical protein Pst134EB_014580 [Puccinia striiformis f. sp. tritici]|nr:hypothetical protein Pst134EB_014580 [Puccinia striiformis f. sp. tritici]